MASVTMSSASSSETGLRARVHFSKILSQFVRYFQSPPMRDGDGLEGTDADRFVFLNTASQKRLDGGLLAGREIFSKTSTRCFPYFHSD
jgi:hypothetical protein